MLAAIPQHIVETSHFIYLIVSYIPFIMKRKYPQKGA